MALDKKEQRIVERYFDMASGYVLHYTNRTFAEFFETYNIDIYDEVYEYKGTSKANRLRCFFEKHSDKEISKVILDFIKEYDIERGDKAYSYQNHNDALRNECIQIAQKLQKQSPAVQPRMVKPVYIPPNHTLRSKRAVNTKQIQIDALAKMVGDIKQPEFLKHPLKSRVGRVIAPNAVPTKTAPKAAEKSSTQSQSVSKKMKTNKKVFIVHGHDQSLISETEIICHRLGLQPIVLKDQASKGATIIEKIENNSDVGFAIILYTACDEGRKVGDTDFRARARQNVVFEHGYFVGRLGRGNVAAVIKGDVEIQGDVNGVVYVPHDTGAWHFRLAKEMQSSGLDVDLNKL